MLQYPYRGYSGTPFLPSGTPGGLLGNPADERSSSYEIQPDYQPDGKKDEGRERAGVISDFEPLTANAAAKAGIPLINLNHPAVVRRYFSLLPDAVSAKVVAAFMTPPAQKNLICSFYDGDVGPILRQEIRRAQPERGDYILVYVKKSSSVAVKKILAQFPRQDFHFFPDKDKDFIASWPDAPL